MEMPTSRGMKSFKLLHTVTIHSPSALNGYSLFLLHFGREDSNPLWNRLNPRNTVIMQGDVIHPRTAQPVEGTHS